MKYDILNQELIKCLPEFEEAANKEKQ